MSTKATVKTRIGIDARIQRGNIDLLVELKFVNNVKEKNETIQCWREFMKTGAFGDVFENA